MIQRCTRCVTPLSRPGLKVDEYGICSACRWEEQKTKEALGMDIFFDDISLYGRDGNQYECLVTVSGGKDSHYQTYIATEILKLRTLTVTWACCQTTPEGAENLENLIQQFNVAHVMVRPAPRKYPEEMRCGLINDGDCCMPCHHGIFTEASKIAKAYDIPIVLWGENPRKEYGGGAEVGEDKPAAFDGVTHLYVGDYLPWDARKQVELMRKYGFQDRNKPPHGAWLACENVDCGFVGIHDYFAWLKFGMSRASIQLSIEIRKNRMTRDEALRILDDIEPVARPALEVKRFLEFSGMTMTEFETAEKLWKTTQE